MNLSKQAIVALVADLYKKLDKLGELWTRHLKTYENQLHQHH
jgi:hypothetical protein